MKKLISLLCIAIIGGAFISPEYALTLTRSDNEQVNSSGQKKSVKKKSRKNKRGARKHSRRLNTSQNQNAEHRSSDSYNESPEEVLQNQDEVNSSVDSSKKKSSRRKKKKRFSRRAPEEISQGQDYDDSSVTSSDERPAPRKKKKKNRKKRARTRSNSSNENTVMITYKKKRKSARKNITPHLNEAWKDEIIAFNSAGGTGVIDPIVDSSKINHSSIKIEAKPITGLVAQNAATLKLNNTMFKPAQVISKINIDKNLKAISEKVTTTPDSAPIIYKTSRSYAQQPKHNYRKDFKETIRFRQELEKYRQTFA